MPFAGYKDFDACVAANQDKSDPEAYCGAIKHKVEGKMGKFTQNPDFPEPGIDIVTKKKKKTGFYSIINTKIGSMRSLLEKRSQTGSKQFYKTATLKINQMKKMVSGK